MNSHSLVLFAIICQDEILELNLHFDPLLVGERRPDVMRLGDGCLVRFQDHLGTVIVDVQSPEDQDEPGEGLEVQENTKHTIYTEEVDDTFTHKTHLSVCGNVCLHQL